MLRRCLSRLKRLTQLTAVLPILLLCVPAAQGGSFSITTCNPSTEYFDTTSLTCTKCANSDETGNNLYKVPDLSTVDIYGNPLGCKCADGYKKLTQSCSDSAMLAGTCVWFTCSSCMSSGHAAYSDGSECATCGSSTEGLSTTGGDCTCAQNSTLGYYSEALVEADETGRLSSSKGCMACPAGNFVVVDTAITTAGNTYAVDAMTCRSCPDEHMSYSSDGCQCDSGYSITGLASMGPQRCVKSSVLSTIRSKFSESDAYTVNYYALQSSTKGSAKGTYQTSSYVMKHWYLYALSNCYAYKGADSLASCQVLANLCVLQHYDTSTKACSAYRSIQASRAGYVHSEAGWAATLPWLYYDSSASSVTQNNDITMRIGFKSSQSPSGSTYSLMKYKLIKYAMNGTWLGVDELSTELMYCNVSAPYTDEGAGGSMSTRWLNFGSNVKQTYYCDLSRLAYRETFFYELYIVDQATGMDYPVPVRNYNLRSSDGTFPNQNTRASLEENDVFVRRFFLFDRLTGVADGSSTAEGGGLLPVIIRYAQTITLTTTITRTSTAKINPPVLAIEYVDRLTSTFWSDSTSSSSSSSSASKEKAPSTSTKLLKYDQLTFDVQYTMDTATFWQTTKIFFSVACVITSLIWLVRVRNWQLRTTRMLAVVTQYSQSIASVNYKALIEIGMLLVHSIVLVFFPFIFLICAFWFVFFKLQSTVFLLLPSSNENYKSKDQYYPLTALLNMLFFIQVVWVARMIYLQTQVDIFFIDWERPRLTDRGEESVAGVSVWRTILAANEWAELQVTRRTNLALSLFGIAFFLVGLKLQYNAVPVPDVNDHTPGELNPVLRFANTTFWWLLMSTTQLLWKWAIYERYISEPKEQFLVDLCTIAKVSILVLDEKYHGWYLHCRSPYPFADGTMMELLEQLKKEEAGLTTDRGLEGGPKDVQVFELFVTEAFRQKYEKAYRKLYRNRDAGISNQAFRLGQARRNMATGRQFQLMRKSEAPPQDVVKAMSNITNFLQDFVDQSFTSKDLKRHVREPTLFDKYMRAPPDLKAGGTGCVMYPDRTYGFTKTMLLGNEVDLLLLNILMYSVCDVWFGNTAVSILLTFVLDWIVVAVRGYFGQWNMASKTMVDERFLI